MYYFSKIIRHSKIIKLYREFSNNDKIGTRNLSKAIALNMIGAGSTSEAASVCVSVGKADKYLFNCGEDFHRLFCDQNRNLSSLKHVFFTRNMWNCMGGVSCISSDVNNRQGWLPMFHGPNQLYRTIKRVLCLSILSELDFLPIDCNQRNFFKDDTLRVDFLSTKGSPTNVQNPMQRDVNEAITFVGEIIDDCQSPAYFMSMNLFIY